MKTSISKIKQLFLAATLLLLTQSTWATISNLVGSYDATNVTYRFTYTGTPAYLRLFLDTDRNSLTGARRLNMGADYLVENGNFYRYSGVNGAWGWTRIKAAVMTKSSTSAGQLVQWTIARADLGSPPSLLVVGQIESPLESTAILTHSLSSTQTPTTTTVPPSTVSWTRCAQENATCSFTGTRQVRYGANGIYAYKTTTGSIACNNATFGDPVVGVTKYCDYSSVAQSAPVTTTTLILPPPTTTTMAPPTTAFQKPALVNPVNPLNYGARCDGVTDDSAAFQSAMQASDVLVPAGRTCVINRAVTVSTSNRRLECGSGTILKMTVSVGRMFNYVAPSGSRMSGNSIVNCHFIGTNTVAPQADWNDSGKHYNIPVQTQDRVDNFLLAGNTFERFWGQSMFQTYGAVDGGRGSQIIYNTFKSCGYYGPVFVAHQNGRIANNTMVDCATGVENNDSISQTGGIVIENNTLTCIYGYGGYDMGACAMLTGGATENGANYSTNIVRNNAVSGTSLTSGFQGARGSRLIIGTNWGVKAAQYSNNSCTNGCVVTP